MNDKPLVWLAGQIKTPPLSGTARVAAGLLLRRLQRGERIGMPHARSMPTLGRRCLELRLPDNKRSWRILLRADDDAIVIAGVFEKKTQQTPKRVLELARNQLRHYDATVRS